MSVDRDYTAASRITKMLEKIVERLAEIERTVDAGGLTIQQKKDLMGELIEIDRVIWDLLERSRRTLVRLSRDE